MPNKCCEIECGADACESCGACLTEHNEDPVNNCPQNPKHRTTANCERIKELDAKTQEDKELLGECIRIAGQNHWDVTKGTPENKVWQRLKKMKG